MRPHSGVGGLAPRPRNDRPATSRITVPMSSVICTTTGPKALGRMWRSTILRSRTPITLAASTYGRSRSETAMPRTRRVYHGHHVTTIARARLRRLGPEDRHHGHGEDEGREGQEDVGDAHDRLVGPAPVVAREASEERSHEQHRRRDHGRDDERDAGAEDHPAEHVAPLVVGPERVLRARRLEPALQVGGAAALLGVRRDPRRRHGDEDHQEDPGEAQDREPVAEEDAHVVPRLRERRLVALAPVAQKHGAPAASKAGVDILAP